MIIKVTFLMTTLMGLSLISCSEDEELVHKHIPISEELQDGRVKCSISCTVPDIDEQIAFSIYDVDETVKKVAVQIDDNSITETILPVEYELSFSEKGYHIVAISYWYTDIEIDDDIFDDGSIGMDYLYHSETKVIYIYVKE